MGIDRFMSEARALTNFAGNAVATVLVGHWTGGFDKGRAALVLGGGDPFDEATLLDEHDDGEPAQGGEGAPARLIPPAPLPFSAPGRTRRASPGHARRTARWCR
ncbi:hypothetical protein ACIBH1_22760 [Nonomuraea sp. NPDC050663]|uniref:hypothetical protein n=1 Tax=Nonomuraea sp. NPDC050663 TaxID=3364370 RepID=UPI003788A695